MGFFGTFLFDGTRWSEHDPGTEAAVAEPWLLVDIYDSDITTVKYGPAGPGRGIAYLGYTPRTYFEDDSASEPTSVVEEADGLAAWWRGLHPEAEDAALEAKAREIEAYVAADDAVPDTTEEDGSEPDDADVFVEIKTARFLNALGLPRPVDLPG